MSIFGCPIFSANTRNSAQAAQKFKFERPSQNSTPVTIRSPPPTGAPKAEVDASGKAQVSLKSGKDFPEHRFSTVNVDANPVYPAVGKPITELEIDADLAEQEKPWRRPGADPTDYFNYGFDEFTWSTYCMRQNSMKGALQNEKDQTAKFDAMMGGGGFPGMPAMPAMTGGAPMMPGMPNMNQEQMAQAMQQAMMMQGVTDPSQVDFNVFMSVMAGGQGASGQGGGAVGQVSQQQGGYGGQQQGWQQQGGRGGKGGRRWQ